MVSWSLIWAPELLFVPSSPLSPRQVYGHCEEQLQSCLNASCSQEQHLQPRDTAEPTGPEHFKVFQLAAPNLPKTLPMWSGHSQCDQTTPFSSTSLEDSNAFFLQHLQTKPHPTFRTHKTTVKIIPQLLSYVKPPPQASPCLPKPRITASPQL